MTLSVATLPTHERLDWAVPAAVLDRLPEMGRVMVILRAGGATHERIGPVGAVNRSGGVARLTGDCHDCLIDIGKVGGIGIDRSSVMKDKANPRLNFRAPDGAVLFAVVGMVSLDPFEAALAGFARTADAPDIKAPGRPDRPDLAEDDACRAPFDTLVQAGKAVVITARTQGATQSWTGIVEAVKPAMGFLKLMTADFHLHLEGGSLSGWRQEAGERIALGPDGQPTGLILSSDAFA